MRYGILCALLAGLARSTSAHAMGTADLELTPASQSAAVGDTIEVVLRAVAQDDTPTETPALEGVASFARAHWGCSERVERTCTPAASGDGLSLSYGRCCCHPSIVPSRGRIPSVYGAFGDPRTRTTRQLRGSRSLDWTRPEFLRYFVGPFQPG